MLTLTIQKRTRFPARYAKKDARTLIYRALYGRQEQRRGPNDPSRDVDRCFPFHWTIEAARLEFAHWKDTAQFTPAQIAQCEKRLHDLRDYKHKTAAD